MRWPGVAVCLCISLLLPMWAFPDGEETFGCEANPTGNPIGGGDGYSPILTTGDFTCLTVDEFVDALAEAADGQVIFIPDGVEIDMTGQPPQKVPGGVTIAGTRGLNGSLGARIFTTDRSGRLFDTAGDFARITGLRFEGGYGGADRTAESSMFLQTAHYGLEVDNCEIFNFNVQAIQGVRGSSALYIHHNYIHHSMRSGNGYGVSLYRSDARIIANKFDYCRHCIASSGDPGCSYEAAWNLVLPNQTAHHFDMHGGADRGDGTDIAGDWIHIHHNTFVGDSAVPLLGGVTDRETGERRSIVIRGIPSQGAVIHNNWFSHPVAQTIWSFGYRNVMVYRNIWGPEQKLEE